MKYLMMLFLMFGFSSTVLADDAEDCVDDLTTEENECEDDEGGVLFSADDFDADTFANQDHIAESRKTKREMLKLRAFGEQLDKMKLNNVVGIYGVTSKELRENLTTKKNGTLAEMKEVLHSAARDGCETVLQEFQMRIKTLQKKPTDLKSFASYVESKSDIGEEVKERLVTPPDERLALEGLSDGLSVFAEDGGHALFRDDIEGVVVWTSGADILKVGADGDGEV